MTTTRERIETFEVSDGHLIRRVVPRRGEPYEHRCPLDIYRELIWAAIDLAAGGFTLKMLTDQVRNRPRDEHDDREPWASYTHAAIALAFWKERGLVEVRHRRNYVTDECFFEDAMLECYALAENG